MSVGLKMTSVLAALMLALPLTAQADPPPWAPAHGYRAKHGKPQKHHDRATVAYVPYLDLDRGHCNRDVIGAALGGAAGAAVGSQVARGDDKLVGIIGGAALGAIVGGMIGRSIDQADVQCVGQALERASDGQEIVWNDDGGARYAVMPTETFRGNDGRYCREYTTSVRVGGKREQGYGQACRQPDGSWQIVRN